jgi:benzoate-CoA ligase
MENRVLLLLYDSPEFAASFFGAMKIGAVPVPVNTMMRAQDYVYFLNDSRAKVVIAHRALWDEVARVRDQLAYLKHVVIVGEPEPGQHAFDQWIAPASPALDPAPTSKDDAAFWLYSSGSTGFPKGAVHLHHDMIYCSDLYARPILDIGPDDITFSAAKLFFAYGLGNSLTFPLSVGASAVLDPARPTPQGVAAALRERRPTLFFAVPTFYAALLAADLPADTFASVRLAVSAGEPLPAGIFHRFKERFGLDVLDGLGTTEALHIFISNRPGDIRPGTTGFVVPGYRVRLVSDEGAPVPPGETGHLEVSGESVATGYWCRTEVTRRTFKGEWLRTGDVYSCSEDGVFTYAGRSDDMIKAGGIWVSPAEVEATLVQHPDVQEAAVVGRRTPEGLQEPAAYVVTLPGRSPGAEELVEFCRERLAAFKRPRQVLFVDDLPKTATGKIQRYKLRDA